MTNMNGMYGYARIEPPKTGSTTWHRGQRCTVVDTDTESFVEPMTRVMFADGRIAILKQSEMGLRAADITSYLASIQARLQG